MPDSPTQPRLRRQFITGLGGALVLAAACDAADEGDTDQDPSDPGPRIRVGVLDGTDVALALVVEGTTATAYVCGGPSTFETHTRWFRGMAVGSDGSFSGSDDGWVFSGTLADDGANGSLLDPSGLAIDFEVTPPAVDSDAGLYTALVDGCETGVIVRDGSSSAGYAVQGTWCNTMDEFAQVIILQPLAFTSEGIEVEVDRGDGTPMRFFVAAF